MAMERNVARLFQERGPMFSAVEFTQASVLAGASLSISLFTSCQEMLWCSCAVRLEVGRTHS